MSYSWRSRSACIDTDPEVFFPIGSTGVAAEQIRVAKSICLGCAVQRECLDWALTTRQDTGIWGAHTEEERRLLRREPA